MNCQVNHQLGINCIFFFTSLYIFKCSLKRNLKCAQVQHRVSLQVRLFIRSFCRLLCCKKCANLRIFKSNSIVTSSAHLISTSNAPSCASLYRSQSTPLYVPSDELSVTSSIALTNATLGAPSSAMSNESNLSLSNTSSVAL